MISSISILLCILAATMLIPGGVDYVAGNPDWQVFAASSAMVFMAGAMGFLASHQSHEELDRRGIFAFVSMAWLLFSAASAIPFYLSGLEISYTDAFFEAASGLTTTGSTVLTGLDEMPPGILLWRSITQWIGGLGIVVMGLTFLPFMRLGGQQLFALESSDKGEKPFPQAEQYAVRIAATYLVLTLACMFSYVAMGMTPFDALNHAMTTLATGGYSTSDQSMGKYDGTGMLAVSTVFMLVGGLPFIVMIRAAGGAFMRDIQIAYYVCTVAVVSFLIVIFRAFEGTSPSLHDAVSITFNVTSVITTTGYASEDYMLWGGPTVMLFFFITFIGGCAGSTAGGFKQFRMVITDRVVRQALMNSVRPHQVIGLRYGHRPITETVASSVMFFAFLYAATFVLFAVIYNTLGMDVVTSVSASATALANVGPGIGDTIGPAGNFSSLPDAVKWMLSVQMIVGRLELMSVFIFLSPYYWRA